jgi:hypothetical protein
LHFQNQEKFANIWLVLTIQTVMPVGFTILLLYAENKQRNQRNGASRFKEKQSHATVPLNPGDGLIPIKSCFQYSLHKNFVSAFGRICTCHKMESS